jgi:ketopantoate reductase
MKIGIIGVGNIGGTLTRRLTAMGHEVSVANSRGPETLAKLAKETGAKAVNANEAARARPPGGERAEGRSRRQDEASRSRRTAHCFARQ